MQAVEEPRRPNVVLVFSDQHRMASFPGEPHTSVIAPHLERLAGEGARFTNAISNYPVCSPYRAMLLTGRAPFRTGVVDNGMPLPDDVESMGDAFRRAGYRTGYIGKWHLGWEDHPTAPDDEPRAGAHGFDHFEVWRNTNAHYGAGYWDEATGAFVKSETYNATVMTDHALDFIGRQAGKPFLLVLSLNPPHSESNPPPPEFVRLYEGKEIAERPNVREMIPAYQDKIRRPVAEAHRSYLAHISAVDHEVGRLLDRLGALGLADDTVVVYTSDHGFMLGSQGRAAKRQPFEESIRIPLLMRWPGHIPAGSRIEAPTGVIDFLPTLCGLTGIAAPPNLDGHDLSALVRGQKGDPPEFQPIMHLVRDIAGPELGARKVDRALEMDPAETFRGVRTQRFMYAATHQGPWLLYDLESDPFELENRIDDPAYRKDLETLHALTAGWLRAWDDAYRLGPVDPKTRRPGAEAKSH
jgi:arylsulfatase A-like enzyme